MFIFVFSCNAQERRARQSRRIGKTQKGLGGKRGARTADKAVQESWRRERYVTLRSCLFLPWSFSIFVASPFSFDCLPHCNSFLLTEFFEDDDKSRLQTKLKDTPTPAPVRRYPIEDLDVVLTDRDRKVSCLVVHLNFLS